VRCNVGPEAQQSLYKIAHSAAASSTRERKSHRRNRPLRIFGAQVRGVLLDNAARKLDVPVEELTTEPSVVVHAKSSRKLGYGDIAAFADVTPP